MEMNFCRRCGKPLHAAKTESQQYNCDNGHTIFPAPIPGVGVFFVSSDNQSVLLSTRGIEPRKGMLDAFGGFSKLGETFEESAQRELQEELGLTSEDYEPLSYLTSGYDTYPYQGEVPQFIAPVFWTRLRNNAIPKPADDVAEANWHKLATIDMSQLQSNDIRAGIRELQKMFSNKEKNNGSTHY